MADGEIRLDEKEVKLSNQDILDLGLMVKDFLGIYKAEGYKPTFEQANCYDHVFNLVQSLLNEVDPEYLPEDSDLRGFFNKGYDGAWQSLERRQSQ